MNPLSLLAVAGGGALGSVARYLVGIYAGRMLGTGFPWGTLFVNITGSFLIGALAESFALRWDAQPSTRILLVTGICGGYTTFSAFSLEVVAMIQRGDAAMAALYVVLSVGLSIGALLLALQVMRAVLA
jgi:CrcB protein